MGDDRRRDQARPWDPAEGVRIIGADEAAEAIERGDVAERRGDRLPRYGDRPAKPPVGPKPALRFPLEGSADPAGAARVRPAKGVRFDPRPAPAWDEPAVEDTDDDPWPAEDTWGVPASGGWDEPHDDVVAWSQGQTGSQPAAGDAPAPAAEEKELSWAEGFVDDENDPWDGSWDEPTGAISWADDTVAPAVEQPVAPEPADDPIDEDPVDEDPVGDQWAAFGGADEGEAEGEDTRRKGRRIFARRHTTDADPEEPPVAQDPTPADPTPGPEAEIDLTEASPATTVEETGDDDAWGPPSEELDAWGPPSEDTAAIDASGDLPGADQLRSELPDPDDLDGEGEADPAARGPLFDDAGGWAEPPAKVFDFADDPSGQVELPHWTDPPTGELPRILAGDEAGPAPTSTGSTPAVSWQGHDGRWGNEGFDDLIEDEGATRGALDDARPHHDDAFDFEELDAHDEEPPPPPPPRDPHRIAPARPLEEDSPASSGAGRPVGVAIGVGVGFAAVALAAFALGPAAAMVLVVGILFVSVVEYQNAIRRAGYRPSVPVGLVAAVAIPLAVYAKGVDAYPVVAVVLVGTLLAWHLLGVDGDARVVESAGVTLFGILWIVGLGSFAALLLSLPDGVGMLITALLATIGYDVGGYAVGRSVGTRRFSDASPNKTVEGLLGGMGVSLFVVLMVGLLGLAPFDGPGAALKIGVFAALAAPLGDLCESLVKRDLGVKDMGSILPEHGGMLDRFDALLFVLPAVYFGAVFFELGPFG
ncbi:hypothetical protein BH24ACT4_BH24ACT4_11620 [soil metagenome]